MASNARANQPPNYSFLAENETVIHALETKDTNFIVTDRRFVILKKGGIQEDFEFNYIAHISSEKETHRLRKQSIIGLFIGLALRFWGFEFYPYPLMIYIASGIILIAFGLLFFRFYTYKLIINLSGVSDPFEYEIKARSEHVQRLVSKIASARAE